MNTKKNGIRSMILYMLAACMLFTCACAAPAPSAPAAPAPAEAPAQTAEAPAQQASEEPAAALSPNMGAIVGVSVYSRRSQSQLDMEAGLRVAAAQLGFSLLFEDADTDPARQSEHILGFIEKQVDLLIVNPTDPAAIKDALLKADAAGIPVITMEMEAPESGVEAHLGFDYTEEGALMAEWLANYINTDMGGSANIGVVDFASCKSICQVKLAKFEEDMRTLCPGALFTAKYDGQGKRSESMDACEMLLKKNPETNILIVFNADAASGVSAILQDMKRDDVFIFGSAYGDDVFKALASGDPHYKAFAADRYYQVGWDAIAAADKLLRGEAVEAQTFYPSMMLSAQSILEYDFESVAAQRAK